MKIKSKSGTLLHTTRGNNLVEEDLRNLILPRAKLSNLNMYGSDFGYTNLSESDLSTSDLHGTSFNNSNLSYSDLSYSYIRNANLTGANLCGADLRGADFTDSNLEDVVINEWTIVDESTKLDQGQLVYLALRGLKFYEY